MIFRKRAGIQQSMNSISKELELGDWKLLNVLSYNMAPIVLGEFITELATQVKIGIVFFLVVLRH